MSPLIFLLIIAILYLASKPKFRFFVERDGMYLSRDWTSFVNAFFISLVVCSHSIGVFETSIRDYILEKNTASGIDKFGQLMVTTFFFYSGYGIMLSLLNRKGYAKVLIYPRFCRLATNFALAVGVYFVAHCLLSGEIILSDFLGGLHDFGVLGNPSWFILMTLLTYVLTYVCFSFHNEENTNKLIICLTILLAVALFFVSQIKPFRWVDTLLCFPAGMFYYLKGESMEKIMKKTGVPSIIYALIFIISGRYIYLYSQCYSFYIQNIGGIIFAIGTTWFCGSFQWRKPSRVLIWLGGSGLFSVYMFHLLPMRVITKLGFNTANPYLVYFSVTVATALLVYIANIGYKKINNLLFSR